jgi:hypothetical protein
MTLDNWINVLHGELEDNQFIVGNEEATAPHFVGVSEDLPDVVFPLLPVAQTEIRLPPGGQLGVTGHDAGESFVRHELDAVDKHPVGMDPTVLPVSIAAPAAEVKQRQVLAQPLRLDQSSVNGRDCASAQNLVLEPIVAHVRGVEFGQPWFDIGVLP